MAAPPWHETLASNRPAGSARPWTPESRSSSPPPSQAGASPCARSPTTRRPSGCARTTSRNELSKTVCEHLNWTTPKGDCRVAAGLRLLEACGILILPPLRDTAAKSPRKPVEGSRAGPGKSCTKVIGMHASPCAWNGSLSLALRGRRTRCISVGVIGPDHVGGLFRDHDRCRIRVRGYQSWHD